MITTNYNTTLTEKDIKDTKLMNETIEIKENKELKESINTKTIENTGNLKPKTKLFYSDYGYINIKSEEFENDNNYLVTFENKKCLYYGSISVILFNIINDSITFILINLQYSFL